MAAAGAEGRTMRRDRPAAPERPGFAFGLGSRASLRSGSATDARSDRPKVTGGAACRMPTEPIWGMSVKAYLAHEGLIPVGPFV